MAAAEAGPFRLDTREQYNIFAGAVDEMSQAEGLDYKLSSLTLQALEGSGLRLPRSYAQGAGGHGGWDGYVHDSLLRGVRVNDGVLQCSKAGCGKKLMPANEWEAKAKEAVGVAVRQGEIGNKVWGVLASW